MDWQYLAVYLIVGAALVHVVRQFVAVAAGTAKPSAACGSCSKCRSNAKPPPQVTELVSLDALSAPPPKFG